jgi:Protein of unknown function (DUF3623)
MTPPSDARSSLTNATDVMTDSARSRGLFSRWLYEHWSAVGKGTVAVVGFWWFVTGVVVALQRNEVTRLIAWALATLLAGYASYVIHAERSVRTAASARKTFLAATAIWMWINVGLYGGWIVGPSHAATTAGSASVFRATEAIASLLWHELLCVLLLFGTWLQVRVAPNKVEYISWRRESWCTLSPEASAIFADVLRTAREFRVAACVGVCGDWCGTRVVVARLTVCRRISTSEQSTTGDARCARGGRVLATRREK